jgi:kynurenine formamidase
MFEIIDLSQEIFTGMPVFPGLPEVKVTVHLSHEQLEGVDGRDVSLARRQPAGTGRAHGHAR